MDSTYPSTEAPTVGLSRSTSEYAKSGKSGTYGAIAPGQHFPFPSPSYETSQVHLEAASMENPDNPDP